MTNKITMTQYPMTIRHASQWLSVFISVLISVLVTFASEAAVIDTYYEDFDDREADATIDGIDYWKKIWTGTYSY